MKFKTIVVDPPWMYGEDPGGIEKTGGTFLSGSAQTYNVMTLDKIKSIPVKKISDKNCHLFLWTTVPFLKKAMDVLVGWNFEYKTAMFWEKVKSFGLGYWFRNQYEVVLIGKVGDAKPFHSQKKNCFTTLKIQPTGHSEKPDMFYKLIEEITDGPRIDIFARKYRDGWTCIGNEIDGLDIFESINKLLDK